MPTPPGDVSTTLGIFITAVNNIFNKVDTDFRLKYPDYTDQVDGILELMDRMCIDDENHISSQMIELCNYFGASTLACSSFRSAGGAPCPDQPLHDMLKEFIELVGNEPKKVFDESLASGRIPMHSMN
jgi:hypothetical protein